MKTVTLQFPSLFLLWKFKLATNTNKCKIHYSNTITCQCNVDQLNLAVTNFRARVLAGKVRVQATCVAF